MFADLNHRKTGMLHVVRAEAAVVGAAVAHFGIEALGHLRRLDVDLQPRR